MLTRTKHSLTVHIYLYFINKHVYYSRIDAASVADAAAVVTASSGYAVCPLFMLERCTAFIALFDNGEQLQVRALPLVVYVYSAWALLTSSLLSPLLCLLAGRAFHAVDALRFWLFDVPHTTDGRCVYALYLCVCVCVFEYSMFHDDFIVYWLPHATGLMGSLEKTECNDLGQRQHRGFSRDNVCAYRYFLKCISISSWNIYSMH